VHHDGFADDSRIIPPHVPDRRCRLKGVAPKHVTLNQIFAGMMPYMIIVLICLVFMYIWPGMTLWLPEFLYGK